MSKGKIQKSSPLIAAAMAVSAAGLFTAAGPAQALPPAPLAPGDCAQWGFPATIIALNQDTGEVLTFTGTGAPTVNGPATWRYPNGLTDQGHVQGDIAPDGTVRVVYDEGARTDPFFGNVIDDSGVISGTREPNVPWKSLAVCATKGEATEAGPAPGGAAPAPAGTPETRCIPDPFNLNFPGACQSFSGDVDVYDVPGGVGTVIGMLEGGEGQRVQLGSGCKEDRWCNIAFPAGPGGTAWVWGDFLK